MTRRDLKAYLFDPARDRSPAVLAARDLFTEHERVTEVLTKIADLNPRPDVLRAEIGELKAAVENYRRENERLRAAVNAQTPAPWEKTGD